MAQPRTGLLLAVLVVGTLGYIDWRVWDGEVDTSPITPPPITASAAGAQDAIRPATTDSLLRPLSSFPETTARPLFNVTRRPIQIEPDAGQAMVADAPTSLEGVRLVGVARQASGPARALIASPDLPLGTWIDQGQTVAGWRLGEVSDTEITFENGHQRHMLALYMPVKTAEAAGNTANAEPPRSAVSPRVSPTPQARPDGRSRGRP